jgi:hypothetical protein
MGFRIMSHRAGLIGGKLDLSRDESGGRSWLPRRERNRHETHHPERSSKPSSSVAKVLIVTTIQQCVKDSRPGFPGSPIEVCGERRLHRALGCGRNAT